MKWPKRHQKINNELSAPRCSPTLNNISKHILLNQNSKTSKTIEKGTASITTRFRSVEDNRLYKGNNVTIILPWFTVMVCCNDYEMLNYRKCVPHAFRWNLCLKGRKLTQWDPICERCTALVIGYCTFLEWLSERRTRVNLSASN